MFKQYKAILIPLAVVLLLYGCTHHRSVKTKQDNATAVVSSKSLSTTLYYSGIIQPLKTILITSPAEGVVEDMKFHYGDVVKKNQLLFTVTSEKFQSDYKNALMTYVKAKTDFINNENQLKEGEFLHKNQLISDDDYKTKKTNFYNAQLGMLQAKDALVSMLKRLDLKQFNIDSLTIEDVDKITRLMQSQNETQKIQLFTPSNGIVLLPNKGDGADGDLKHINKGDQIKQGDVLAVVGDVSGLMVRINVSEFNINQLKVGQKVKVSGAAFPNDVLQGEITGLDRQGQSSQGGLPVFAVEITVPTLTEQQHAVIHMGMSAKVAIETGGDAALTVPLKAIIQKNGQTYVQVREKSSGKQREVLVKTGATTLDSVVIESGGITQGDELVITG